MNHIYPFVYKNFLYIYICPYCDYITQVFSHAKKHSHTRKHFNRIVFNKGDGNIGEINNDLLNRIADEKFQFKIHNNMIVFS
jgi:hypothetical protein